MQIGCKVTIRGKEAEEFVKKALWIRENRLAKYSFDPEGNFSFGIQDYTDFPGMKYDPEIGIFGLDVSVSLSRPGKRVQTQEHHGAARPEAPQGDAGRKGTSTSSRSSAWRWSIEAKEEVRKNSRLHQMRQEAGHRTTGTGCTCADSASERSPPTSGSGSTREVTNMQQDTLNDAMAVIKNAEKVGKGECTIRPVVQAHRLRPQGHAGRRLHQAVRAPGRWEERHVQGRPWQGR